ncbi:MAG: chemotaxis protein CheD [Nitrospirae bacterium]|nr:chemotaxis protein CheD [Nitrospirota bacterium]
MSNEKLVEVRLGEWRVATGAGQKLVIERVGAGVAIVVVDLVGRACGGAHCILPEAPSNQVGSLGKFANMAAPLIVEELNKMGAQKGKMVAKIAGGAQMLSHTILSDRNIAAAREALRKLAVPVTGEDVGGRHLRTLEVDLNTGEVTCYRGTGEHRESLKL